ncbi:MAG TPA: DedA family protein [Candidatus Omnitrophica bacterium]|nr:MAG: hypothetical protein DRP80_05405 [Candidatus Omnitrophota bacterium]HEC69419.1 DedA family protein [Candidatus Omnitrophota bacterium]
MKIFENITLRFIYFILLITGLFILSSTFSIQPQTIDKFLRGTPLFYSCILFVFLYVVGTFFIWYLKDPLKIIGAVLFGAYLSTLLIYIAEIINAVVFFNLSSILGREFVEKKLRGRFKNFYQKLEDINLGWVFLLRFIPLIPYRVLDLSFGLSRVPLKRYLLAVVIASPPRIFWIQVILASVKSLSPQKIIGYFSQYPQIYFLSFLYAVVTLIFAFRLKKIFKSS